MRYRTRVDHIYYTRTFLSLLSLLLLFVIAYMQCKSYINDFIRVTRNSISRSRSRVLCARFCSSECARPGWKKIKTIFRIHVTETRSNFARAASRNSTFMKSTRPANACTKRIPADNNRPCLPKMLSVVILLRARLSHPPAANDPNNEISVFVY